MCATGKKEDTELFHVSCIHFMLSSLSISQTERFSNKPQASQYDQSQVLFSPHQTGKTSSSTKATPRLGGMNRTFTKEKILCIYEL